MLSFFSCVLYSCLDLSAGFFILKNDLIGDGVSWVRSGT